MPELNDNIRKPKSYFFVDKTRCPFPKCNKQTSHIIYVMVGEHLDIKSLIGAFCENHATKRQSELDEVWDCFAEKIDEINKKIENDLRNKRKERL